MLAPYFRSVDRLSEGLRVVDVSGMRVGRVRQMGTESFQVETDAGDPFWVRQDAIFNVTDGVLTLICNEYDISRYKADEPPA